MTHGMDVTDYLGVSGCKNYSTLGKIPRLRITQLSVDIGTHLSVVRGPVFEHCGAAPTPPIIHVVKRVLTFTELT